MSTTHFSGPVSSAAGFDGSDVGVTAGAGITAGTGTVIDTKVTKVGKIIKTEIFIDLTGLASSTTDLDVIGVSTTPAYLTQFTTAVNGAFFDAAVTCLEVPTGGIADIELWTATDADAAFDDPSSGLTSGVVVVTSAGAWTLYKTIAPGTPATNFITADDYLYLLGGAAGTAATYTAGQFLIELWGYEA